MTKNRTIVKDFKESKKNDTFNFKWNLSLLYYRLETRAAKIGRGGGYSVDQKQKIQNELCHHTVFQHSDKDNLGSTEWILMGKKQYGIQTTLDDTSCGVNTGTN